MKDTGLERKAVFANIAGLAFCITAIAINYNFFITLLVCVLAILQLVHSIFGDFTTSYKLLRKRNFFIFYLLLLFLVSFLIIFIFFLVEAKIYFLCILFAFWLDFFANKTRNKKRTNKTKGIIGLAKK